MKFDYSYLKFDYCCWKFDSSCLNFDYFLTIFQWAAKSFGGQKRTNKLNLQQSELILLFSAQFCLSWAIKPRGCCWHCKSERSFLGSLIIQKISLHFLLSIVTFVVFFGKIACNFGNFYCWKPRKDLEPKFSGGWLFFWKLRGEIAAVQCTVDYFATLLRMIFFLLSEHENLLGKKTGTFFSIAVNVTKSIKKLSKFGNQKNPPCFFS